MFLSFIHLFVCDEELSTVIEIDPYFLISSDNPPCFSITSLTMENFIEKDVQKGEEEETKSMNYVEEFRPLGGPVLIP